MKRLMIPLLLLLVTILFSSCSQMPETESTEETESKIVIGFSQVGAESDWRAANTASMLSAFSESNGYRLILDDAQQKPEKQIMAIRNFIQMGVDYIVLAPTTETGWDTVLSEAQSAGIPVIVVDRMIEVSNQQLYTSWVGSDFFHEGQVAVQWLKDKYADQPIRIAHLQGNLGSTAQLGRTQALLTALNELPWQLVAQENGDFTQAKGQELVEDWIKSGIQFDVLYSENDNMTYGAIEALNAAGLIPGKDVIIVSFDATRHALDLTMNGQISFEVECNPLHGPRVCSLIEKLRNGKAMSKLNFVEEQSFSPEQLTTELILSREY